MRNSRYGLLICGIIVATIVMMAAGCGGGSDVASPDDGTTGSTGTMQVLLTDAPASQMQQVWVNIGQIQLVPADDGDIVTLDESVLPNLIGPVDLLTLTDTVLELGEADVPVDTYEQIRLVLKPEGNSIVLPDNTEHALTVPSGVQSGVKVNFADESLEILEGSSTTLLLDFMAAPSVHKAGQSGMWIMRPVINATTPATDQPEFGEVSGTVLDGAGDPVAEFERNPVAVILEGDNGRYLAHIDGDDGEFEIPSVLPGEYDLSVGPVDQDGELVGDLFPISAGDGGDGAVKVDVTVSADSPVSLEITVDMQ